MGSFQRGYGCIREECELEEWDWSHRKAGRIVRWISRREGLLVRGDGRRLVVGQVQRERAEA